MFDDGRRDNDLFHTANCLVKGGMPSEEIAQILENLIISWGEKPDPEWVNEKIKSAVKRAEAKERNIAAEVRELAVATHGHFLATEMHSLATLTTREQKRAANETLRRMVAEGVLEHTGIRNGQYRLIKNECDDIDFLNADDRALDIWLPFGLNRMAETMPGNIVVIAGVPNAGKTAFLLNIARYNWDKFKIFYFSSEMAESELKKRLKNFNETTLTEWHEKVKFKERSDDFADVIKPGEGIINIVDFLEVYKDFYEVGGKLANIHRKLKGAVAVVAIQKNPGATTGLGGWRGVEKPRLYLNIGMDNICQIVKAKNWATKENPNGKQTKYIIRDGCNLSQSGKWHVPSIN